VARGAETIRARTCVSIIRERVSPAAIATWHLGDGDTVRHPDIRSMTANHPQRDRAEGITVSAFQSLLRESCPILAAANRRPLWC